MLGLSRKLPVTDEERLWVDRGFERLGEMLGRDRLLNTRVILPTDEYFPDLYDRTSGTVATLFERICDYMRVDPGLIELETLPDEEHELRELMPFWQSGGGGCAGLYTRDDQAAAGHRHLIVALKESLLKDPLPLIATIAHELGHVILLGGELIDPATPDLEQLTDLLTVFLGFGIFTSTSAALFRQYQDERKQGWSMLRHGYLRQQVYGYALARFAVERNEINPQWTRHLSTNVKADFKRSSAWIVKNTKR